MNAYLALAILAVGFAALGGGLWLLDRWWTGERLARRVRANLSRQLPPPPCRWNDRSRW